MIDHLQDIELAASVAAALNLAGDGRSQITVAVSDSVVTLEGEARCTQEREDAEALVRSFQGVAGVINAITLTPYRA